MRSSCLLLAVVLCCLASLIPDTAIADVKPRKSEADKAAREGKGAVSLDGRLIDMASIRMAEALLAKAHAIK